MSKTPSPSEAVTAALNAIDMQVRRIKSVEECLDKMREELGAMHAALKAAREADDAGLPQCRVVGLSHYRRGETDEGRHVILRQTPGGQIVTRPFGEDGHERRWKQYPWDGSWRPVEKSNVYNSGRHELRDVPPQFTPKNP